jgi:hypothetical protein
MLIAGGPHLTPDQVRRWLRSHNAHARLVDVVDAYFWFGAQRSIRPEILVAQAAKETGWGHYPGVVPASYNNFAGIKVRNGGPSNLKESHEQFSTPNDGVRGHVNHMDAYLRGTNSVPIDTPHARYYVIRSTSWAGTIRTTQEMGQHWAEANSVSYGNHIDEMVREMENMADLVNIALRASWGHSAPLGPAMPLPAKGVHIHHSVTLADPERDYDPYDAVAAMKAIEATGIQRFGRFSYSYCGHPHDPNMPLLEGAGLTIGAHTADYNSTSFGLCVIGNTEVDVVPSHLVDNFARLIADLVRRGQLVRNYYLLPHQARKATACPGRNMIAAMERLRSAAEAYITGTNMGGSPTGGDDDMDKYGGLLYVFVKELYDTYASRNADAAGLSAWVGEFRKDSYWDAPSGFNADEARDAFVGTLKWAGEYNPR